MCFSVIVFCFFPLDQCEECNEDRVSSEIMSRLNYDKAMIFVRKVSADKSAGDAGSGLVNSDVIGSIMQDRDDAKDPEFIQVQCW